MPEIAITITRSPDGRISVSGPLHDKLLIFGLFKLGELALIEHYTRNASAKIVAPPVGLKL